MSMENSRRQQSLIPSFLYSSPSSSRSLTLIPTHTAAAGGGGGGRRSFVIPAPSEAPAGKIQMYSPQFYAACTVGGILSCGLTHMAVTPLDLVKCNMQIDPSKYKSISSGFGVLLKEQGVRGFFRGWVPTLLGYSAQGACKFGFYEFFKKYYSDIAGPEYAAKYKTLIYLAGSASAEVIADIALCPMEAVKVRVQTQPGFARGMSDGFPKFIRSEGALGLYKGIVPLWGRQIPYTMMKFASFETIVEMFYKYAIPTPKNECSKSFQLGVSFAGGYVAGVLCAIVSHPADNLVSFLNNAKGATVGDAVKKIGMVGLFTRGLPLRIVMIGTLTGAQWGIYDSFKVFVGLPTTGGAAPVAVPAKFETGPSVSEAAWDKVNLTAKAITGGGFETLYKQTFSTFPYEKLNKTFACYLSTTTGPVAGTLYLSNVHVAFCSDQPLSFTAPSTQITWTYYKVIVPLAKIGAINPVVMRDNSSERYLQVVTVDGHDFWFMGFVNFEKAARHISESLGGFVASGVPLQTPASN